MTIDTAYKPRLVLAALLSRADQAVAVDWLVDVVWGQCPPASARKNVQLYIHRLRATLGNDTISSLAGGYVICAGDGLDAVRFRRLAADGSGALREGDAVRARDQLRAALDLWRGPAYLEFSGCSALADEATRLDDLRLTGFEHWAEAELTLGNFGVPVDVLSDLVRAHPYRESLRGQLMRALYGAGRQADALQLFRSTRALLAEQLGVEPGPQLQVLHGQMLRGDPHLTPQRVAAATDGGAGGVLVPRELPADVSGFAGREDALKALDAMRLSDAGNTVGPVVVSVIAGTAGVGKTALAVHWAHRVAGQFPDGQLYLNLRGYAPGRPLHPIEALTTILATLGIPRQQMPVDVAAAAARYRSFLAGRRMLIVLDNARSSAQVRPLLPASAGCLVVVTSRGRLTGLVAQDGARRFTLDVLSPDESVDLLGHLLGGARIAAEPIAAAALASTCAHLPLALRIAGAGLADQPHRTIADCVAELAAGNPVAALAVEGEEDVAVRGAFELSYRTLPQPAQQMFRRLGLVPLPDFTASAAAALAGTTEPEALQALDRLAAAHLVVQHAAGRYTAHDLLRLYAADLAATEECPPERVAAVHRLYELLVATSVTTAELLYPDMLRLPSPQHALVAVAGLTGTGPALDWLDTERHNLVAAILHAARHGPRWAVWRCADALRGYYDARLYLADWLSTSRAAVAAARAEGDLYAQAAAYLGLAHARFSFGQYRRSTTYLHRALALTAEAGWDRAEATVSNNLGIALHLQGRTTEAIQYLHRALRVHDRIDVPIGRAVATRTLASACQDSGRLSEGAELAIRARELYTACAARNSEAFVDASLGELYALAGRLGDAEQLLKSALARLSALGSRRHDVTCRAWLARVYRDLGRLDEAGECAQAALELADEVGEPRLLAVARHALALVHQALGDHAGAIRLFRAALTIAEQGGIQYTAGEALLGLAATCHGRGDHQAAIDHAARALTLARQAGYAVIEGRAHTTLGQVHHHLGDTALALDHAHRALTNHQCTGHRNGEADTHLLLATLLHHVGDHTTADQHAHAAHTLYHQICAPQPVP